MVIKVFQGQAISPYVSPDDHCLSFFANNTLCLRREVLEDVGLLNNSLSTSEDVELCSRIFQSRWRMYSCREMRLHHRARRSLLALMKQWWGYGKNIPRVFKARSRGEWEVILFTPIDFFQLLGRGGKPFTLCIFLNPFLLMHVFLLSSLGAAWLGFTGGAAVLGVLTAYSVYSYFAADFIGPTGNWQVAAVRYLANSAFFLAHLAGGLSCRTLYLPQVTWQRRDMD